MAYRPALLTILCWKIFFTTAASFRSRGPVSGLCTSPIIRSTWIFSWFPVFSIPAAVPFYLFYSLAWFDSIRWILSLFIQQLRSKYICAHWTNRKMDGWNSCLLRLFTIWYIMLPTRNICIRTWVCSWLSGIAFSALFRLNFPTNCTRKKNMD